jgi:hypothetical protein
VRHSIELLQAGIPGLTINQTGQDELYEADMELCVSPETTEEEIDCVLAARTLDAFQACGPQDEGEQPATEQPATEQPATERP